MIQFHIHTYIHTYIAITITITIPSNSQIPNSQQIIHSSIPLSTYLPKYLNIYIHLCRFNFHFHFQHLSLVSCNTACSSTTVSPISFPTYNKATPPFSEKIYIYILFLRITIKHHMQTFHHPASFYIP